MIVQGCTYLQEVKLVFGLWRELLLERVRGEYQWSLSCGPLRGEQRIILSDCWAPSWAERSGRGQMDPREGLWGEEPYRGMVGGLETRKSD